MTAWTALVPIKSAGRRKTRLGSVFSEDARDELADRMLHRVLAALAASPSVREVIVLSSVRPKGWRGRLSVDHGRGLNPELAAAARGIAGRLMVVHADLPTLAPADVETLVAMGEGGAAIAPDRWSRGTNALAAREAGNLRFAFGPDSLALHRSLMPSAAIVRRPGLALDLDLPRDLEDAVGQGFLPPTSLGAKVSTAFDISLQAFTC
ncbi:Phosphoenolpyruvate guanylyltransferase [Brevundimonas sp. NIBR10]|uniref:2-phospho-L-lactate guanylyltransferase n=1 Tax=Brevundimonas sp. NIBR10 TaxID=3015997 RepID=UPI0022F1A6BB|nr:2-phospho-L-lactate guanylyltransferase [Brevundimonas sp. NIBR10]WGM47533.1 Phosphoenolpyruvate guanylyltransferase [Brevundimonas sp. NIBR10]